jgi:hypothetical protein
MSAIQPYQGFVGIRFIRGRVFLLRLGGSGQCRHIVEIIKDALCAVVV